MYVSGQLGLNPITGDFISDDVELQTHQVLKNIREIINSAEFKMNDIVKTTVLLKDMKDFQKVNYVYQQCNFFFDNIF